MLYIFFLLVISGGGGDIKAAIIKYIEDRSLQ